MAKYSDVKDTALIERIEWGATDPHGRVFEASLADIQDTFFKEKFVDAKVPVGRIAPASWVSEVAGALGPFTLAHDDAPGAVSYPLAATGAISFSISEQLPLRDLWQDVPDARPAGLKVNRCE